MSCVHVGLEIYFQTSRDSVKFAQISKNPNVALCAANIAIEGVATIGEHPLDPASEQFITLYQKHHYGSFNAYSRLESNVVIRVDPTLIAFWKYDDLDGLEEDQINAFKGMAVVQTQAHLDAWKEHIFPGTARANYAFLDRLQRAYSFDIERLPQPFPAPTLFLLGRQDSAVGYRDAWRIIENYPHASFVVLDRAGHCLQMEQPRLYEALIHEWLDRVEEYAAKSADGKMRETD